MSFPIYQPIGDQAVLVSYEERIDPKINERVQLLSEAISQQRFPWLEETVFSYRSLLVIYHPQKIHFPEVVEAIRKIEQDLKLLPPGAPDTYEIPTIYGGTYGPDLDRVAQITGLSSGRSLTSTLQQHLRFTFWGFCALNPTWEAYLKSFTSRGLIIPDFICRPVPLELEGFKQV